MYYKKNRETILNRAKEFYEIKKKGSKENARNKYRELSEKNI